MAGVEFDRLRKAVSEQAVHHRIAAGRMLFEVAEVFRDGEPSNLSWETEHLQKAAEERKLSLSLRNLISYLNEMEDAIITKLEHEGVDLTGIIEPELVEPQAQQAELSEEDEEAKKRIGIEWIRRHMGNLEAFKTGDPEVDKRLDEPLESLRGVGYRKRYEFEKWFKIEHKQSKISDFLSRTPDEIKGASHWSTKGIDLILEQIYERGMVPDEKWDYFNAAEDFIMDHGALFSDEAWRSFQHAVLEAGVSGKHYVGSEHLFFGMMRDEGSAKGRFMAVYGINPEQVKTEIERLTNREADQAMVVISKVVLTERASRILGKADESRRALKQAAFGDAQVLGALLQEEDGIVVKAISSIQARQGEESGIDLEAKKEAEIERIRGALGDPEKFKTMDDPEGNRLDIPLWKLEGFTEGLVRDAFGRSEEINVIGWQNYLVRGLLSKTYAELTKRGSGIGHVRGRRILEILHANDFIPDEEWAYVRMVQGFVKKSGLNLSTEARHLLMFAALEASKMGVERIGSEHLLLGALRDASVIAALKQLRPELETNPEKVRQEVLRVLNITTPLQIPYKDIALTEQAELVLKQANETRIAADEKVIAGLNLAAVLVKNMLEDGAFQEVVRPTAEVDES